MTNTRSSKKDYEIGSWFATYQLFEKCVPQANKGKMTHSFCIREMTEPMLEGIRDAFDEWGFEHKIGNFYPFPSEVSGSNPHGKEADRLNSMAHDGQRLKYFSSGDDFFDSTLPPIEKNGE